MPIEIHGKQYKTVAERVNEFWNMVQQRRVVGFIHTSLLSHDDQAVIMLAQVGFHDAGVEHILGSGHAEELRGSTKINTTSALENCETSAIGRALAAAGLAGTEFASANEVQGAIAQQDKAAETAENDPGKFIVSFGKYRGETVAWITDKDPGYRDWAIQQCNDNNTRIAFSNYQPEQSSD